MSRNSRPFIVAMIVLSCVVASATGCIRYRIDDRYAEFLAVPPRSIPEDTFRELTTELDNGEKQRDGVFVPFLYENTSELLTGRYDGWQTGHRNDPAPLPIGYVAVVPSMPEHANPPLNRENARGRLWLSRRNTVFPTIPFLYGDIYTAEFDRHGMMFGEKRTWSVLEIIAGGQFDALYDAEKSLAARLEHSWIAGSLYDRTDYVSDSGTGGSLDLLLGILYSDFQNEFRMSPDGTVKIDETSFLLGALQLDRSDGFWRGQFLWLFEFCRVPDARGKTFRFDFNPLFRNNVFAGADGYTGEYFDLLMGLIYSSRAHGFELPARSEGVGEWKCLLGAFAGKTRKDVLGTVRHLRIFWFFNMAWLVDAHARETSDEKRSCSGQPDLTKGNE